MPDSKAYGNAQPKIAESMPGMRRSNRFPEVEHAHDAGGTLKRLLGYFAGEKALVILMSAVTAVGTVCGVYAPSLQSRAIDIIAGTDDRPLVTAVLAMLLAYLIYSVFALLRGVVSAYLSQNIVERLRTQLFGKLIDVPVKYLDTHSHGDVMSRMTNDVENISTVISQALPSFFYGILTLIGTTAAMLYYCVPLALLSCTTIILTMAATKFLSSKVRKYSRRRQMLMGMLNGTAEEMISGYRTVVAYDRQDRITEDFCETADELTKAGIKTDAFSGVMGPVMNCIGNIGFVIIAVMGGWFAVRGFISVGVISAFIVYAKQFSRPVNEIAQIYGQLQTALAGAERIFEVLDEDDEDMEGEEFISVPGSAEDSSVSFRHVTFSYVPGRQVIRDFSLDIPSGRSIALVGATGSGKTTVINLLMRFYDADDGRILVGGRDIKEMGRASLRKRVAIVLQDTVLFTGTVRENLSYGKEDASRQELEKAASMSRCGGMIEALPKGYDTVLTGGGEEISQGQRQLLAIARALAADPEILILDEATSNVDTRTEQLIQNALHSAMEGRTSIIIAHRLSTIRDADTIIVMDQGSIVESGNHDELLARGGRYYELYQTQFAGFKT